MIRGFGRETFSTYCQTLNGCDIEIDSLQTILIKEYFFLFVDIFW